ncbi:MAG: ATP-binding protein [Planctomycetia bacterium]|nr:ATP-binding protein [Planctomycetia bacterium]
MSDHETRRCQLQLERNTAESETIIKFAVLDEASRLDDGLLRGVKNKYQNHKMTGYMPLADVPEVHLIEGYSVTANRPLYDLYTKAVQNGRRNDAIGIVSDVLPGVTNVEILTEHGEPILYFVFEGHSVPATLVGDGIQSLLRLSLELAATGSSGLALLEEPEVHQHPGAIRQSARAILAAVRRGIQVILTTHSLELLDALLAESKAEDLEKLSLYRLQLKSGVLQSSRLAGPDVAFARTTIEDDLR